MYTAYGADPRDTKYGYEEEVCFPRADNSGSASQLIMIL